MCKLYNIPNLLRTVLGGLSLVIFIGQADAQIKIGTNGSIIAPSSLLELESANQGLLLPRLADTAAINALSPPNGMLIYLTKAPAVGLYVRKVTGWEYLTGSLAGNGNFNSLTVAGAVTAGSFSGPLNGNATSATLAATATTSLNSAIINDNTTQTTTFPTFVNTTPGNAVALRSSSNNLTFVPSTGILTAKGFNGPLVGNVIGTSSASTDATNTVNIRVTEDDQTPATVYPTFVTGTAGPFPPRINSAKLGYIPLTGELTATSFRGNLTGNASTATTVSGNVAAVNGGTGQNLYTPGDLLFAQTSINLERLGAGTGNTGRVLRVNSGGFPEWQLAGAGSVTNVSSPNNTLTIVDPTVSPQIDISATYPGQASIRTVGPLSAGSLSNGFNPVNPAQGGTGLPSLPVDVLIGNGTAAVTVPAGTNSVGNVLTSRGPGLAPQWTVPAGTGDMLLAAAQTNIGVKTFNDGTLVLKGSGTGTTTLKSDANTNGTVTLPGGNVTLVSTDGTAQTISSDKTFSGTTSFTGTTTLGTTNISALNATGSINGEAAVSVVGGAIAASIATDGLIPFRIVRRDGQGDFNARDIQVRNLTATGSISGSLSGNATTASSTPLATVSSTATITNNNDPATYYPTFVAANSGARGILVDDPTLTYNPSTGTLSTTTFQGSLLGTADRVTTNANLTGVITSVGNATSLSSSTGSGAIVLENAPILTGNVSVTAGGQISTPALIISNSNPPIHSTDPGTTGEVRWDANFMYIYTGAQWKRIPLDGTAF